MGRSKKKTLVEELQDFTDEDVLDSDLKLHKAQEECQRYKSLYKTAQERLVEAEEREQAWMSTVSYQEPIAITPKESKGTDAAVAVFVASDWHVEERVDPKTVNGMNEYNLEIAEDRCQKVFQNALKLIRKERASARVDRLVLAALGDFIAGHIHEELAETNYLHPVEAVIFAKRLLCGGIEFLLEHGGFEKIYIPCCYGNHGRTGPKRRISNAAKTSYEWLMYHQIAEQYKSEKRLQFQIADGALIHSRIYNTHIRWHHGDNIRFLGGVGGLTVPLNKAIAQWNQWQRVDMDVLGHYHNLQFFQHAIVNGSLIGPNAYALSIKAAYEPAQQGLFLVSKDYGSVCFNRVLAV